MCTHDSPPSPHTHTLTHTRTQREKTSAHQVRQNLCAVNQFGTTYRIPPERTHRGHIRDSCTQMRADSICVYCDSFIRVFSTSDPHQRTHQGHICDSCTQMRADSICVYHDSFTSVFSTWDPPQRPHQGHIHDSFTHMRADSICTGTHSYLCSLLQLPLFSPPFKDKPISFFVTTLIVCTVTHSFICVMRKRNCIYVYFGDPFCVYRNVCDDSKCVHRDSFI